MKVALFLASFLVIFLSKCDTTLDQKSEFSFEIIELQGGTFGYDIYKKGILVVHQPFIPAINNKIGFGSKGETQKVALFVINKIKNGEMPPSLSIEELKYLSVLK